MQGLGWSNLCASLRIFANLEDGLVASFDEIFFFGCAKLVFAGVALMTSLAFFLPYMYG